MAYKIPSLVSRHHLHDDSMDLVKLALAAFSLRWHRPSAIPTVPSMLTSPASCLIVNRSVDSECVPPDNFMIINPNVS